MPFRGKILKVPDATPGMVFVNGQQKSFEINETWASPAIAPAVQMTVEVELGGQGNVTKLSAISDADLAKEEALKAMGAASQHGKELAGSIVAKVGVPTLVSIALIIAGWFFFDYYSTTFASPIMTVKSHVTFWRGIGLLHVMADDMDNLVTMASDLSRYSSPHSSAPPTGFYGFFAIVCLLGPLVPVFWKDRRAALCATLPLLFALFVMVQALWVEKAIEDQARKALEQTYTMVGGGGIFGEGSGQASPQQQMKIEAEIDKQVKDFKKAEKISLDLGFYLSILPSLYLAGTGTMKFLSARAKTSIG
ncbi:MAG: hypothetical protein P4M01_03130 [Acidobacteriota bacterium]|nr:hypothetical protein [Acidobacteriota bacterium]